MSDNSTSRASRIRASRPARVLVATAAGAGILGMAPTAHAAPVAQTASTSVTTMHTIVDNGQAPARKVAGHHIVTKRAAHRAVLTTRVRRAFHIAQTRAGDPYVYGATGPNAFDCSGLTSYAYHRAGFRGLPRTAAEQAGFVHRIPRSRMHVGDLIFFYSGGHVYHVGLFAGWSQGRRYILHAPYPGQRVHREALWTDAWFAGTMR
jgi:cell wall-associated NlpC family hydrolase